ncbi:MAG: hypothetical protein RO257_04695 [Candidatus Kapabacteria bacterium]|nr:hypothetical protein [Candidatus Kapabacteria bacterium]
MELIYKISANVLLCLIIISCGSGRISNLERKPDEAIMIAKLNFKDDRKTFTKSSIICFDDDVLAVKPDDSCYIYFKLPLGRHYISRVFNRNTNSNQKLPDSLIWFVTNESKIYYIGDIYLNMDIDYNGSVLIGGLLGAVASVAYEHRNVYNPDVYVEDNFESAKSHLTKLFPTNETIYRSLVEFDSLYIIKNFDSLKRDEEYLKLDPNRKSNKRRKMIK